MMACGTMRNNRRVCRARSTSIASLLAAVVVALSLLPATAAAQDNAEPLTTTPVLAYYYIWFMPESWDRAKLDLPLLGAYSSDDPEVMRLHVQWAKASGIDGFIVSWKHTEDLTPRLRQLIEISREEEFKLVLLYEGLDFYRHPLPVERISADLAFFTETFGDDPVFDLFGKPVAIWSGTWKYDRTQIATVTEAHRPHLQILATQKQTDAYERIADLVDGNAYYWSSVDPDTFPDYPGKLREMGGAVHAHNGLWIAPAAPGFDARHLGGKREVLRENGATLTTQLATAAESAPDAIGLISWNEFSESSHIEPSCVYGDTYLAVVADALGGTATPVTMPCDEEALAIALAGTDSPAAAGTPPLASPAISPLFDWDSSAPGGQAEQGNRLSIILLIGLVGGSMIFSMIRIVRRAVASPSESGATAIDPALDSTHPPIQPEGQSP